MVIQKWLDIASLKNDLGIFLHINSYKPRCCPLRYGTGCKQTVTLSRRVTPPLRSPLRVRARPVRSPSSSPVAQNESGAACNRPLFIRSPAVIRRTKQSPVGRRGAHDINRDKRRPMRQRRAPTAIRRLFPV